MNAVDTSRIDPGGLPRLSPEQLKAPWKKRDRIGLVICWIVGVFFCVVAAAIVLFIFVQGVKHLRPELLWTRPEGGFADGSGGGGLFDPLAGTLLCAVMATAIAAPIGVALAVWLSEFGRPFGLARATEAGVEMIAGAPSIVLALFGVVIFTNPRWDSCRARPMTGLCSADRSSRPLRCCR